MPPLHNVIVDLAFLNICRSNSLLAVGWRIVYTASMETTLRNRRSIYEKHLPFQLILTLLTLKSSEALSVGGFKMTGEISRPYTSYQLGSKSKSELFIFRYGCRNADNIVHLSPITNVCISVAKQNQFINI